MKYIEIRLCTECPYHSTKNKHGIDDSYTLKCNHPELTEILERDCKIKNEQSPFEGCPLKDIEPQEPIFIFNKYYNIDELLNLIDLPNRMACKKIYSDNKEMFDKAQGSLHNHQAWEGGYMGHMRDIMNIAFRIYTDIDSVRPFPFLLSDALLILFLHDIEKPWKYGGKPEEVEAFDNYQEFQLSKIEEYGFQLTKDHWNAITYAHGEGKNFKQTERVSKPLAAFIHCCDTMSARIWFDYPREEKW